MNLNNIRFATIVSILAAVSCGKTTDPLSPAEGKAGASVPVNFAVSAEDLPLTKTSYSGEVIDGKERIDWADGDQVKIYLYRNNGLVGDKDYSISSVRKDKEKSVGSASNAKGFFWRGEDTPHNFYSYYPASASATINNKTLSFTLPSHQKGNLQANMQYAYMAAAAEGKTDTSETVTLDYYPMVTTLSFTFRNNYESGAPMTLKRLKLSALTVTENGSTVLPPIAGTYSASLVNGVYEPNAETMSNTAQEVYLDFDTPVTIPYGETYTCAFFLPPRHQFSPERMQLLVVTDKGGITAYLENSQITAFEKCKKYNLKMNVLEGKAYFEYTDVMAVLLALSNATIVDPSTGKTLKGEDVFEYQEWTTPPGLYYKKSYAYNNAGNPNGGLVPVSDQHMIEAINSLTVIEQTGTKLANLLPNIPGNALSSFPNLEKITFRSLAGTSITIENLDKIQRIDISSAWDGREFVLQNCNFDTTKEPHPSLTFYSVSGGETIRVSNVTGLETIVLKTGIDDGNGNIADVTVENCPDLKYIRIERTQKEDGTRNGQVMLEHGIFKNLDKLESIYIDNANQTKTVTVEDCPLLTSFTIENQTNWTLESILFSKCASMTDGGFKVERGSGTFEAYINSTADCPGLKYYRIIKATGDWQEHQYEFKVK